MQINAGTVSYNNQEQHTDTKRGKIPLAQYNVRGSNARAQISPATPWAPKGKSKVHYQD